LKLHVAVNVENADRVRDGANKCNCGAINSESTFRVERSEFSTNPEHEIEVRYGYSATRNFRL